MAEERQLVEPTTTVLLWLTFAYWPRLVLVAGSSSFLRPTAYDLVPAQTSEQLILAQLGVFVRMLPLRSEQWTHSETIIVRP